MTLRQAQILAEIGNDKRLGEIAREMHLSPNTVKNHASAARDSLQTLTLTGAVVKALHMNYLRVRSDGSCAVSDEAW